MPKYGLKVYTWGTQDKVSNGLDNFVDQYLNKHDEPERKEQLFGVRSFFFPSKY